MCVGLLLFFRCGGCQTGLCEDAINMTECSYKNAVSVCNCDSLPSHGVTPRVVAMPRFTFYELESLTQR